MTKEVHEYVIITIGQDGKEKRVNAVAKDVYDLILGITYPSGKDDLISEFFLTLMCEGQSKIEDHVKGFDHIVYAK